LLGVEKDSEQKKVFFGMNSKYMGTGKPMNSLSPSLYDHRQYDAGCNNRHISFTPSRDLIRVLVFVQDPFLCVVEQ
jgi:hypothetical protein